MSRNPMARAVRSPLYRQRIVPSKHVYTPDAEEYRSLCDCCGEYSYDCMDTTTYERFPMDAHACAKCRGEESEERERDADWRFAIDWD